MANFDADQFKQSTRMHWDNVAEQWNDWGPLLDRWLGPATEAMLDMCRVTLGSHVLHVAGGSGQDALQSARRVGPEGRVLSTDFSAQLTRLANDQFRNVGMKHAQASKMDGEDLDVEGERWAIETKLTTSPS